MTAYAEVIPGSKRTLIFRFASWGLGHSSPRLPYTPQPRRPATRFQRTLPAAIDRNSASCLASAEGRRGTHRLSSTPDNRESDRTQRLSHPQSKRIFLYLASPSLLLAPTRHHSLTDSLCNLSITFLLRNTGTLAAGFRTGSGFTSGSGSGPRPPLLTQRRNALSLA